MHTQSNLRNMTIFANLCGDVSSRCVLLLLLLCVVNFQKAQQTRPISYKKSTCLGQTNYTVCDVLPSSISDYYFSDLKPMS